MRTITLLRKPLEGTVADNVLKYGCGGINIDTSRIPLLDGENTSVTPRAKAGAKGSGGWKNTSEKTGSVTDDWKKGRWPANVILTSEASKAIDKMSGHQKSGVAGQNSRAWGVVGEGTMSSAEDGVGWKAYGSEGYGDEGGASRYFKTFTGDQDE